MKKKVLVYLNQKIKPKTDRYKSNGFSKMTTGGMFAMLLCLLFLVAGTVTLSGSQINRTSTWGYGMSYAAQASGDYIYMGSGRVMEISSISSPNNPVKQGSITLDGIIKDIFVSGNYAYVAIDKGGLRVVNITNPQSPVLTGSYSHSGEVFNVFVDGNRAYLLAYYALKIIDVTNPANPVELGEAPAGAEYNGDVYVSLPYAYIVESSQYWGGLTILDISSPTNAVPVGSVGTPGYPNGITYDGSYIYIADQAKGLCIVDATTPSTPVIVGSYTDEYNFHVQSVAVANNLVYAGTDYGLAVFDVSTPATPILKSNLKPNPPLGMCQQIALSGTTVYRAGHLMGQQVINVSDPTQPVVAKELNYHGSTFSAVIDGSYAYISNTHGGIRIMDISNPANPVETGTLKLSETGAAYASVVSGSYLYVAASLDGLLTIDISNPSAPTQLMDYVFSEPVNDVCLAGSYLYLSNSYDGVVVMDISNPAAPAYVTRRNMGNGVESVFAHDGYLYAVGGMGMKVMDLTNPASPAIVGTVGSPSLSWARDVYVSGTTAYVADSGIKIFDISNPAGPTLLGSYNPPNFGPQGVHVWGTHAFVSDYSGALCVLDVSDPSSPAKVDELTFNWQPEKIFAADGLAIVADWECGFSLYDISAYAPQLKLTSPNGGEDLEAGTTQTIRWSSPDNNGTVTLDYSTDNGQNWIEIVSGTADSGTYDWTVPNDSSVNCLLRITKDSETDNSDAVFTISEPRTITLTSPNGGETWDGGSTQTITWSSTGTIPTVRLTYSTNGGNTWETIHNSVPNTGSYSWTVPSTASVNCKVRLYDPATVPAVWVEDISETVFQIQVKMPPVADFSASTTAVTTGGSVGFYDQSTNNPTSWSWTFNGGTPSTSSVQNPVVSYNTAGTYSVTLTATNDTGNDTKTKTAFITVTDPVATYCSSSGRNCSYEWIASVQVGTMANSSGSANYTDFTSVSATLSPGTFVDVTLTPGFSGGSYQEYWKVWIDFNKDGDFNDPGEEVYSVSGRVIMSGGFTVPANATGVTRMRVAMKWAGAPTPCETFSYGEVEDYTVNFN